MRFPQLAYIEWAKTVPPVAINLARSGVALCPVSLLGLRKSDLVATLPVQYGYAPLRDAIARRYRVKADQVYAVSGGTGFANWLAAAAALDGCAPGAGTEVIVERPTYEPLLKLPEAFGVRTRRLDRRDDDGYAIDVARFAKLVTPKTRLAIVSNLHNPSGARIELATLREMAAILARVGAYLLVDEVYLECLFGRKTASCVHAGPNVIVTNSLTKAYGLDGLRAGWILGPPAIVRRAGTINNLLTNNSVAPGERMTLAAFEHLGAIATRARGILRPNLTRVRRFLAREPRVRALLPEGGNVVFLRLPRGVDPDVLTDHLRERYDTAVVPGRFFESPHHIRISCGMPTAIVDRGLANISHALDDLAVRRRSQGPHQGRGALHQSTARASRPR